MMYFYSAFLLIFSIVVTTSAFGQAPQMRGISLPLYAYHEDYDYQNEIAEIAATGANSLNISFSLLQENAESTLMAKRKGRSPSDLAIRRTIQQAKAQKLTVFVLPLVLLADPREGDWRGNLQPTNRDDWFANYGFWIKHYAKMCEEEGVDWFGVGSEFASLENETEQWKNIIQETRNIYSGKLLYSCNWDHLHGPEAWWNELDAVGLSSYYELTKDFNAPQAELNESWLTWKEFILNWKAESGVRVPLVFTEVGYPSIDGGAVYPWNYTLENPADWEEQEMAYRAFIQTWDAEPDVLGVYFYKWKSFSDESVSYSPKGKPAEALIRGWFATPIVESTFK
ncbi:MAG: hypothetical protein ACFCU1_13370 [Sumerlaeia bacterium]